MCCSRLLRGVVIVGVEVGVDLCFEGGGVVVVAFVIVVVGVVVASAEIVYVVGVTFDVVVGGDCIVIEVVVVFFDGGVSVVEEVGEGEGHSRLFTILFLHWSVGVMADVIAALDAIGDW